MRKSLISLLAGWMMVSGAELSRVGAMETNAVSTQLTIPYVPTRQDVVRDLFWLADVGTNDVVYDLGSGDGRVVITAVRDFGARRAVGIEIDPLRIRESKENTTKAGVADRVEFIHGDLFTNDFSQASVVVLYLGHSPNLDLRAKLVRTLKPGTRIVTHQFGMGEWPPDKELRVRTPHLGMFGRFHNPFADNPNVPDYEAGRDPATMSTLSMWIVPAPVAGVWRGKVSRPDGRRELKLVLHQSLARLYGAFQLRGKNDIEGHVQADLWGNHLRLHCVPANRPYGEFFLRFDGHIKDDAMQGDLEVSRRGDGQKMRWFGHRDKADFAGTWEWDGPVGARPVRLKIERHDGEWICEYFDPGLHINGADERENSVKDFYDFGGGFYFTFRVGGDLTGYIVMDDNAGWLTGEAVAESNTITGTTWFYPYLQKPKTNIVIQQGPQPWQPKKMTP